MSKRLSPSALQPLMQCVCFEYREMTSLDGDSGETMAQRGSRLHKAVATDDLGLCKTEDETTQVEAVLNYKHSVINGAGTSAIVLQEEHVDIPFLDGGTLDFAVIKDDHAWLVDYKFVRTSSVVDPVDNWQLKAYAVGLMLKYADVKSVESTFLSPAMQYVPTAHVFVRADIEQFVHDVEALRARVEDVFKSGTTCEYCDQCANAGRCPAMGQAAVTVTRKLGLPVPEDFAPQAVRSPRDRGIVHMMANAVETWAEDIKKANNLAAAEGQEVLGHRLVSRSGGVKIRNARAAIEALQHGPDGLRLPLEDILGAVSTTPKKLADVISLVHGTSDKVAGEKLKEWLLSEGLAESDPDVKYLQRIRGADIKQLMEA